MVRVISVHHFANQSIQTIEQPTACTVAHSNRLLLALTSHCVQVRDLSDNGDVLFCFPTVDEVSQIVHCLNGNYIATLETKFNRQNREMNFVRVYVNWDGVATLQQSKMTSGGFSLGATECGMVQPMRARIAGRVTPTTNQSELGSLEMIEVPVKTNPEMIACCQISGNLLILANQTLSIHYFTVKTHDISKLKFVDFEEAPFSIQLTFVPTQISFCENYFACTNAICVHVFKVVAPISVNAGEDFGKDLKTVIREEPVDYKKLRNEAFQRKNDVLVNLQTIVRENSVLHRYSPFMFKDKEMGALLRYTAPVENHQENYEIVDLIQLKVASLMYENANGEVAEAFKCLVLKPLYVDVGKKREDIGRWGKSGSSLRSCNSRLLHGVVCMFATQQEGFLYQFPDSASSSDGDNCVAVYPFTAPVQQLVMEDFFLHALTDTGLETYTLRVTHKLCRNLEVVDNINIACPPIDDSVCLAGLRPFLGVEKILLADKSLVLLANGDSSPTHSVGSNSSSSTASWTMYSLELPTPKTIFNDISIVANAHRFTSAQTYCHLMSEAHVVLRTALLLSGWGLVEGHVALAVPRRANVEDLVETYRTSCALLGDHFVMCPNENDFTLALPYYKMAAISPSEVLSRVKKVQEQANSWVTKGLLYYLKSMFLRIESDADRHFQTSSKQSFVDDVLDLFEKHNFDDLPKLVLKSNALREYSVEKLTNILNKKITNDNLENAEKSLALALLYIQKSNHKTARDHVSAIEPSHLSTVLRENWDLLFEDGASVRTRKQTVLAFSELSVLLFGIRPDAVVELLMVLMVEKKVVSLGKVLKAFLEYLPSSIGTDGNCVTEVLQKMLEAYFRDYFDKHRENFDVSKLVFDRGSHEAIKILVRTYLSRLQILQLKGEKGADNNKEESRPSNNNANASTPLKTPTEDKDRHQEKFQYNRVNTTYFNEPSSAHPPLSDLSCLLADHRLAYLDEMPPFAPDARCVPDAESDAVLKQLQALLCAGVVPKQVVGEVEAFLELNETLRGNASLRSILMSAGEGVEFLMERWPRCLVQYGKDRFTKLDDWKLLIATLQRKILNLSSSSSVTDSSDLYRRILENVLTHAATTMKLEQLVQIFPQRLSEGDAELAKEIADYEHYVGICKETMHANQIRKLISATGQQLLCTLHL